MSITLQWYLTLLTAISLNLFLSIVAKIEMDTDWKLHNTTASYYLKISIGLFIGFILYFIIAMIWHLY